MLGKPVQVVIWGIITLLLVASINYPVRAEWLTEYRTDNTRPLFLVANGTTWFTGSDSGHSVIAEVDPSRTVIRRFHLANDNELTDLVLGPEKTSDGSNSSFVWFLQQKTGRIARLIPRNGTIVEWQIPTPNSKPTDLVIHRYGNGILNNTLFFTEQDGNRIGSLRYIVDKWIFKEFLIPTANSKPIGLAIDSRGLIWFAESEASKIGRLDPWRGEFTEYVVDQGSRPWGITIDRNNLVWFAMSDANKIARLDPQTGLLDVYRIPTDGCRPRYIEADAQGSIWFTEYDSGKIGRFILNSTSFAEYSLPDVYAGPYHISVAPSSGDVWVTEDRGKKIAKILPDTRAIIPAARVTISTFTVNLVTGNASTNNLPISVTSSNIMGITTTPSKLTTTTTTTSITTTSLTMSLTTTMTSSVTTTTTTQSTITTTLTTTPSRCIIATAAYGSELAPEVQFLRAFRDLYVQSTFAGNSFMKTFNHFYYSFSPIVALAVAESPVLAQIVRVILFPLVATLHASSAIFLSLSFMPELAIVTSGIFASALVGATYLAPLGILFKTCTRRNRIRN